MNGYEKPTPLGLEVRADMLETVAGYDEHDMAREITFAKGMTDWHDAASLRWLACLIARRVDEIGEAP